MTSGRIESDKVRVCHMSTLHDTNHVRMFHRECCSLARAGYEVHLVTPCGRAGLERGVHLHPVRRVRNRLVRMLVMPWVVMIEALKTRSRIYQYHAPELIVAGFVMRWVLGKHVVFDMHEATARQIMHKGYLPSWLRKPVALAYRCIEGMFIHGQTIILANDGCVPLYPKGAYLARNYPDLNHELMDRAWERKAGTSSPLLVYVGGVAEVRGAFIYVDLVGRLAQKGHNVQAVIAGPYAEDFGRRLQERIRHWNIEDRLSTPGELDYADAMDLVARSTIGLCLLMPVPNYTTCLSTKIIEYMMLGTPTLASAFEVWKPYVEGMKTGRVADPCDLDEVVRVCEEMLADPEELRRMGERGMEAVLRDCNWSKEFEQVLRCYRDLLGTDA